MATRAGHLSSLSWQEGNKQELEKFSEMIKQRSCCSQQVIAAIETCPARSSYETFCIALLLLGCMNLQITMQMIV